MSIYEKRYQKLWSVLVAVVLLISSIPTASASGNSVTVYKDAQFYGDAVSFSPGNYTNRRIGSFPSMSGSTFLINHLGNRMYNDSISSLKVSAGYRVILTDDHNYKDTAIVFEGPLNINELSSRGMNDKTSSIIVQSIANDSKLPVVYEDHGFQKRSQTLSPGDYRKRNLSFGNDKISSIIVPRGYTVKLWDDDKYKDRSMEFTGPAFIPYLNNFNDKTSSLKVWKN